MKTSLEYCTHIVFGYVGLNPDTFELQTLHSRQAQQFAQIKRLKNQYRHIKFLLSLGGGKDLKNPEKYMKLLNKKGQGHQKFISSARSFLIRYKFDGLDLAYQFPETKFNKQSTVERAIKDTTDFLKNNVIVQKALGGKKSKETSPRKQNAAQKQQFNMLISKFRSAFRLDKLMLTLTVLPHVNASGMLITYTYTHEKHFKLPSTIFF